MTAAKVGMTGRDTKSLTLLKQGTGTATHVRLHGVLMRIGLVIERFDPHHGGAEFWAYQHATCLARHGHEVHIVSGAASNVELPSPFCLHTFAWQECRLQRAAIVEERLKTLDLDIIHDIGLGWYCDLFQSEDGSRISQWEHKLAALPAWARPFKRNLLRYLPRYNAFRTLMERQFGDPDRIILAVSKMCADDYMRYHGVDEDRIRVVYHGVDTERFSPMGKAPLRATMRQRMGIAGDEVAFLFVGHDFARKGLATAIRAVSAISRVGHRAKLIVLGDGNRRKLPVADQRHIVFCGRVADPVSHYVAADAFVLPTFYDPCSLSVSEAAACGLPIVTTRANGASELLTCGTDGFILDDPRDDVALARYLRQLCEPATRQRMGGAARKLALRYPIERNCREIMSIYDEIMRRQTLRFPSAVSQNHLAPADAVDAMMRRAA